MNKSFKQVYYVDFVWYKHLNKMIPYTYAFQCTSEIYLQTKGYSSIRSVCRHVN
jgi:hypothetical protein